jgi:twitching motility protein PilT
MRRRSGRSIPGGLEQRRHIGCSLVCWMKTLQQMLRELARYEVTEFAVVSDRLPCVKVDNKYDPIDDRILSTDDILAMLVTIGGSRYVEDIEVRPAHWAVRVEGVGTVDVHAIMRSGRLQARFSVASRSSSGRQRAAAPVNEPSAFPSSGSMAVAQSIESLESHRSSDPLLRSAVVSSSRTREPTAFASLDERLEFAREAGASDVHIVAGRPMLLRLAGELLPRGPIISEAEAEQMLDAIVPERLRQGLIEQGSCDFAFERENVGRFRVNVSTQRSGRKGCFRCIAPSIPTLTSLGLPPEIERATHHHQGLVLVTGPTGHGKTSTLAAIVDIINRATTHHIISVEDPVEYVHARARAMISQREVGANTRSFPNALKASLREDPDVIVVGELRDTETVRMALAASETGHLVIGTMNTPSAAKTIDRMIDLFPPADQQQVRMTLAGGLHLVVGQRLVPTADGKGMAAAVELLTGSIALWSLIRDNKTFQIPSLQQRGKGFGIVRLDESLSDLVRAGKVTRDVAMGFAENPDELEALMAGKRQPPPPPEVPKKADPSTLVGKAGQLFGKRGA